MDERSVPGTLTYLQVIGDLKAEKRSSERDRVLEWLKGEIEDLQRAFVSEANEVTRLMGENEELGEEVQYLRQRLAVKEGYEGLCPGTCK